MVQPSPTVSVLIVGFNSLRFLQRCIGSISQASEKNPIEILFINNGTDQSESFLQNAFPAVRVLSSRGNIGFAGANNALASAASGDWLLLLNPDTQLEPSAIDILVEAGTSNAQFAVLAGATFTIDGREWIVPPKPLPSLSQLIKSICGIQPPYPRLDQAVIEVESVNGGFMLVKREIWEHLEGMDEGFFLYTEEVDFCKRCLDLGGRIGFVPASGVRHDLGSGDNFTEFRIRYMATGTAHYYRKHFSRLYADACVLSLWLSCLVRFVAASMLSWRKDKYKRMPGAYRFVALKPWRWWRGYASPGADPQRKLACSEQHEQLDLNVPSISGEEIALSPVSTNGTDLRL